MGSWSKNHPGHILLPWIRKYGCTEFYVLFCLAALIFRELFPARIGVSGPPNYTWSTAEAEIAPPREPEKLISNETLIGVSGQPKYTWSTARAEIARAGLSGRFWIWVSSAAGGAHWFLSISGHRLALFAGGFVSMHGKFVFDTMHGKLDRFLENQRNNFCGENKTFPSSIFNSRAICKGYENFDSF